MGAFGEELIDTDTLFPEGSLVADALHSVSNVDSRRPKETWVSDSFLGNGPWETEMDVNIKSTLNPDDTWWCTHASIYPTVSKYFLYEHGHLITMKQESYLFQQWVWSLFHPVWTFCCQVSDVKWRWRALLVWQSNASPHTALYDGCYDCFLCPDHSDQFPRLYIEMET